MRVDSTWKSWCINIPTLCGINVLNLKEKKKKTLQGCTVDPLRFIAIVKAPGSNL